MAPDEDAAQSKLVKGYVKLSNRNSALAPISSFPVSRLSITPLLTYIVCSLIKYVSSFRVVSFDLHYIEFYWFFTIKFSPSKSYIQVVAKFFVQT